MIVYEVSVSVGAERAADFEHYMRAKHIPDVMATRAFKAASFETTAPGSYRTCYYSETREALDAYLNDHAPRLRDDFSTHFPDGVAVSRVEWTVLEQFA